MTAVAHPSPAAWSAAVVDVAPSPIAVLFGTARALLRATSEEDVVGTVIDAIRDLGGSVAPPAPGRSGQLPVDITFGIGDPLVPAGDDATLSALAEVLPTLVEDAHVALERARRETHLVESASTDALTGLANRRTTMLVLARLRDGDTVVMLDLDHFKAVNDTYGHESGDSVLRSFARALRAATRAADTAGRLGGEEFVLVLPRTDRPGALRLLERLREVWTELRPLPVTFSAGVAAVRPDGPREALARADALLYDAKRHGRDRVEVEDG